jgi:hypothetical protein
MIVMIVIVETEVNGDSKRINDRGPSWLVRWACLAGTRFFVLPWLLYSAQ